MNIAELKKRYDRECEIMGPPRSEIYDYIEALENKIIELEDINEHHEIKEEIR